VHKTYHRKRNRLLEWDYSNAGWYFVTICTDKRKNWFGEIRNGEMILNEIGKIVKKFILEIPKHYSTSNLDIYQIMPNHIHLIIIIENIEMQNSVLPYDRYGLISKIVKSFKNAATKEIRKSAENKYFAWQVSFHDHIIRNEISLQKIREYIINNPIKWDLDIDNRSAEHRSAL
jgi:putative transposase